MKDGLTTHVVLAAGPNLLSTFFRHYLTSEKNREDAEGKDTARVQLMYDEVFELVQNVLNIATLHTADALQKLCQQRTPVPPWAMMHRVLVPQSTSARAADVLIKALGGEEMAFKVVGGTKWWQVRAGKGLECEWIAMKKGYQKTDAPSKTPAAKSTRSVPASGTATPAESYPLEGGDKNPADCGFVPEADRRCMLFIHGGGYYMGSINTHHYFVWRLAKKIRGRVFAVNYRMAPQYPFPCAIQDVLASYLYLIEPPPGAKHHAVDPKDIIVAGDSAGGGLMLVLLMILRDMGLPLPAGAVAMSPWCDLTHSFPSIMQNTKTDIIPPFSFIHKPSSLWPPPSAEMTQSMHSRIITKVHTAIGSVHPPHRHGSKATRKQDGRPAIHTSDTHEMAKLRAFFEEHASKHEELDDVVSNPADKFNELEARGSDGLTTLTTGDTVPLKVGDKEIVVDTQIQLYATNAQLCHPYVSPVLGYFGGLPPMLVIAGDSEVLRDEIIYFAHKAAHPTEHPVREDVRSMMPLWDGIESRYPPTDVHLQVYDGVGHDIPLFCMTKPGHCAVRAIGSFARWVTQSGSGPTEPPTPTETSTAGGESSGEDSVPGLEPADTPVAATSTQVPGGNTGTTLGEVGPSDVLDSVDERLRSVQLEEDDLPPPPVPITKRHTDDTQSSSPSGPPSRAPTAFKTPCKRPTLGALPKAAPGRAGWPGIYEGPDPFTDNMIRERVDFNGKCRPLEPASKLQAMQVPVDNIGKIKRGAALRYLVGQAKWDHQFKRVHKKVARHRERNIKQANKDLPKIVNRWTTQLDLEQQGKRAQRKGVKGESRTPRRLSLTDSPRTSTSSTEGTDSEDTEWEETPPDTAAIDETWQWQWALHDEMPPPSAIVSRRDVREGRALALQADRIDAADETELNALSAWVILAQLFSTSDNSKIKDAKVMRDDARRQRKDAKAAKVEKEKGVGSKLKGLWKLDGKNK